jgi:dipeptidase E
MVRLFLASIACVVLDRFVELLSLPPEDLTVAFVASAADVYEDSSFVHDDRSALESSGFRVVDVPITGKSYQEVEEALAHVSVIFVAGGNTFYLLEKARASGFDRITKRLAQNGVWYVGSSAGSVLAGRTIEPVAGIDEPHHATLESFEGLCLTQSVIIPHCDRKQYEEEMNRIRNVYRNEDLIMLTDQQALVVNGQEQYLVQHR